VSLRQTIRLSLPPRRADHRKPESSCRIQIITSLHWFHATPRLVDCPRRRGHLATRQVDGPHVFLPVIPSIQDGKIRRAVGLRGVAASISPGPDRRAGGSSLERSAWRLVEAGRWLWRAYPCPADGLGSAVFPSSVDCVAEGRRAQTQDNVGDRKKPDVTRAHDGHDKARRVDRELCHEPCHPGTASPELIASSVRPAVVRDLSGFAIQGGWRRAVVSPSPDRRAGVT
jgi:hypothetical protein